jgi:hypothetical protein
MISLGRLAALGALIFLVSFAFLFTDLQHRIAGYRIAHGSGIVGTATVSRCSGDLFGTECRADFTTADGTVHRTNLILNGPSGMQQGRAYPAAVGSKGADEAWTLAGEPWWRPSPVLIAALVPVGVLIVSLWALVAGGPIAWRAQARLLKLARAKGRDQAHREEVRRGRVH